MTKTTYRYGELFSGPGGLAYGALNATPDFSTARIEHAWAVDNDPWACETYRRNLAPGHPDTVICAGVEQVQLEDLPKADLIAFGFPCNDFSIVGESLGMAGKYGLLYRFGVRALELHSPVAFVAENVKGLKSSGNGNALKTILAELSNAGPGYELFPHEYRFEEYGVPQTRHRIVIVGIRKDLGVEYKIPVPTTPKAHVTSRQAIESPPIPTEAMNHEMPRHSARVHARLKHIKPGENAWTGDIPQSLKLNVKSAFLSQIYKRLDPNRPSYTITGSGGGGTHGYHWDEPRALTNRERARLQTFPDDFGFEGPTSAVRKQIGMAVPPRAGAMIFGRLLDCLAGATGLNEIQPNLVHLLTQQLAPHS